MKRKGFDVDSHMGTRTIAINDLEARLAQSYGVDIPKGTVSCITFGVEAAQREMAVEWTSLNYQYELKSTLYESTFEF